MRIVSILTAGALAFVGAAPVLATQSYVCTFTKECIAAMRGAR